MKSFEEKVPRGRTISTPKSCSVGLERTTKGRLRGGVFLEKTEPRGSLDTDRSTEPPETPRSLFQADDSPAIAAMEEWVNITMDEVPLVGRIGSPKPLRKPDLTFPCASPPSSQLAASAQSFPNPYHQGRVRNKKRRPSAVDDNRNSIISSNRSTHAHWSDNGLHEFQSFSDDETQGYSRSTDSRYSGTKSEGHIPRSTGNPTRTRKTFVQSPSPPPSFNRRPLYHYIRSGASTSQSTFDCGVVPEVTPKPHIAPQQGVSHLARQSEVIPTSVGEPSLPTSIPPITSFSRNGFSLSGETEQRMNLARIVHDDRFVFHESKPSRKRDRLMRGLRRSFKSFFNSKVDR